MSCLVAFWALTVHILYGVSLEKQTVEQKLNVVLVMLVVVVTAVVVVVAGIFDVGCYCLSTHLFGGC